MELPLGGETTLKLKAPDIEGYKWTRLGHEDVNTSRRLTTDNLQVRRILNRKEKRERRERKLAKKYSTNETSTSKNSTDKNSSNKNFIPQRSNSSTKEKTERMHVVVKKYGVHMLELVYMDVNQGHDSILQRYTLEIQCLR